MTDNLPDVMCIQINLDKMVRYIKPTAMKQFVLASPSQ